MSSFSMVSFLITLLLATSVYSQGQVTVKDTAGNPVQTGTQYLIKLVKPTGALVGKPYSLSRFCPLRVVQIPLGYTWGAPVIFRFVWSGTKQTIVDTNSDVTVEFLSTFWTSCSGVSKYWAFNETIRSDHAILLGGNPNRTNTWFKIKKVGADTYEIASSTGSIGIGPGGWFWGLFCSQLILTNDNAKTVVVRFEKVNSVTTSTYPVESLGLRLAME